MGAWGEKNFESDSALDFFGDFCESNQDMVALESAFENIIQNDDYLDEDECSAALVAGEIIAYLMGNKSEDFPSKEEYEPFLNVNLLKPQLNEAVNNKAIKAINKIKDSEDSELRELWEEAEDSYPIWQSVVEDLIQRLKK